MTWNIDNIDGHLPGYLWESFATYHVAAGILVGTLAMALSYPLFHNIYMKYSHRYREQLTRDQQIIVIHHSVEALFLSLLYAPFTYAVLSVNFEIQPLESLGNKFTAMATFMSVIIVMYLIEIASRFANMRALVVTHHLCAYLDGIVTAYCLDTANVKSASLLVYFITYEAPTFVGLIMYRLVPDHEWTRPVIAFGMVVFGLSRPLQFIWIIAGLVETWSNVILWQAIFQIFLTSMFTTLQLYSLTIHYSLYQKIGIRRRLSMPDYSMHSSDDDLRRSSHRRSVRKPTKKVVIPTTASYESGVVSADNSDDDMVQEVEFFEYYEEANPHVECNPAETPVIPNESKLQQFYGAADYQSREFDDAKEFGVDSSNNVMDESEEA